MPTYKMEVDGNTIAFDSATQPTTEQLTQIRDYYRANKAQVTKTAPVSAPKPVPYTGPVMRSVRPGEKFKPLPEGQSQFPKVLPTRSYDPSDPLGYAKALGKQEGGIKGFVRENVAASLEPANILMGMLVGPTATGIKRLGLAAGAKLAARTGQSAFAARPIARELEKAGMVLAGGLGASIFGRQSYEAYKEGDLPKAGAAALAGIGTLGLSGYIAGKGPKKTIRDESIDNLLGIANGAKKVSDKQYAAATKELLRRGYDVDKETLGWVKKSPPKKTRSAAPTTTAAPVVAPKAAPVLDATKTPEPEPAPTTVQATHRLADGTEVVKDRGRWRPVQNGQVQAPVKVGRERPTPIVQGETNAIQEQGPATVLGSQETQGRQPEGMGKIDELQKPTGESKTQTETQVEYPKVGALANDFIENELGRRTEVGETETISSWVDKAKANGIVDNPEPIYKKVEEGGTLDAHETVGLAIREVQLTEEWGTATAERRAVIDAELDRIAAVSRKSGSDQARAFMARAQMFASDYSYKGQMKAYKTRNRLNSDNEIPESAKKDMEIGAEAHKEIQARLDESTKELEKLREEYRKFREENAASGAEDVKIGRRKPEEIAKQTKDLWNKLQKKFNRLNMGFDPETAKIVAQLMKNEIASKAKTLDEAITNVRAEAKKMLEQDWDPRDIRDAFSGYGVERGKIDRKSIQSKLASLKREAVLRSQIEDLEAGIPLKTVTKGESSDSALLQGLKARKRKLTKEQKLEKQIEDAKAGVEPEPRPKKEETDPDIIRLKAELKKVREQNKEIKTEEDLIEEINDLEAMLAEGRYVPRPVRKFREESFNNRMLRKQRNALRVELDHIADRGRRTVMGTIRAGLREMALLNPFARAKDLASNTNNIVTETVFGPNDRAIYNRLAYKMGIDKLPLLQPGKLSYITRNYVREIYSDIKAIKAGASLTQQKYGPGIGWGSKFAALTDVPSGELHMRSMAYDLAQMEVRKNKKLGFDEVFEQIMDPKLGGPLNKDIAMRHHLQSNMWVELNNYTNENKISQVLTQTRRIIREGMGTDDSRLTREMQEGALLVVDLMTRFTRVISNIAQENATYGNPYYAGLRGGLEGVVGRNSKTPEYTARRIAQIMRKGALGSAAIAAGSYAYSNGMRLPDGFGPEIFQSLTTNKKGERKPGRLYVDEGQLRQLGGLLGAFFLGYTNEMIEEAGLSPDQKRNLQLKNSTLALLFDQPAMSNAGRVLESATSGDPATLAQKMIATSIIPSAVRETATLKDRFGNNVQRRDTAGNMINEILSRIPVTREKLPVGSISRGK